VTFTPVKSEPLLRLLIADLVGEEVTRASMATLREDIADLSARLDEAEANAETLPHRRKYLLLVIGFLRGLLQLHLDLLAEVERQLSRGEEAGADLEAQPSVRGRYVPNAQRFPSGSRTVKSREP
jgi:hypothetical protein